MNQAIKITEKLSTTKPPVLKRNEVMTLDYLASRMRMSNETGAVHPDDLPTHAEHLFLERRIGELNCYLMPAGRGEIDELIYQLLMEMGDRSSGDVDLDVTRTIIKDVLHGLPTFAISIACEDFLFGRCGDGKWRPKAGEIRQRAETYALPYREELEEIRTLLEFAKSKNSAVPSDNNRVALLMKNVASGMLARHSRKKREFAAPLECEVGNSFDKYRNNPPKISDQLKAWLEVSK